MGFMTIREKIRYIQNVSGLTQTELAARLGVTFAALNRWFNGKAAPRQRALERINELYRELSGEKIIPDSALEAKKNLIAAKREKHPDIFGEILNFPDIRDTFLLALTYHSNRIEGSTLSENETAAILFENASLPNKSLIEQIEVKNHQSALLWIFRKDTIGRAVNEEFVLKLHAILMNGVRSDAGEYRRHAVRILGANVPTANYLKVPALMKELVRDAGKKTKDTFASVAEVHSRFEQIHPFADDNGRVGRLLMDAMLLKDGFPPAIVRQEKKASYMACLNKSQMGGDLTLLEDFILDAVLDGFSVIERR